MWGDAGRCGETRGRSTGGVHGVPASYLHLHLFGLGLRHRRVVARGLRARLLGALLHGLAERALARVAAEQHEQQHDQPVRTDLQTACRQRADSGHAACRQRADSGHAGAHSVRTACMQRACSVHAACMLRACSVQTACRQRACDARRAVRCTAPRIAPQSVPRGAAQRCGPYSGRLRRSTRAASQAIARVPPAVRRVQPCSLQCAGLPPPSPRACRAAGLPGCRAAGLPGCRDAGMPGCRAAGLQGCRAAGLR